MDAFRDAEQMVQAAEKYARKLHIQMGTLYRPETRAAKRLIDDGHLGRIYHARSFGYRRRGRPFVDGYGTANFVNQSICAGGALFDMGIYHIAQILHLIGNPIAKSVSGATHQELDMYEDRRAFSGYDVEEMGLGLLIAAAASVSASGWILFVRERRAAGGDRRRHALDQIVNAIQAGVDDGVAELFEPIDVKRDVVVDEEDAARAARVGVGDVLDHARDREAMEVAAAHLDDRTETAIESAAS